MERLKDTTIWKYKLPVEDEALVMLPRNSRILCVQVQRGVPYIWAIVGRNSLHIPQRFYVVGTGHDLPIACVSAEYLGTFQLEDTLVFHVFFGGP